jgi:hypothetical protein
LRLRLSTTPVDDFVSALGLSSMTYCLAYCRRVSILLNSSAVLLLRMGPTIISSFPFTCLSGIGQKSPIADTCGSSAKTTVWAYNQSINRGRSLRQLSEFSRTWLLVNRWWYLISLSGDHDHGAFGNGCLKAPSLCAILNRSFSS